MSSDGELNPKYTSFLNNFFFRLFKIQKKIYVASRILDYFGTTTWYFNNAKALELEKKLEPDEYKVYGFLPFLNQTDEENVLYLKNCLKQIDENVFKLEVDNEKNIKALFR